MELLRDVNDWLIARFGELGPLVVAGLTGILLIALSLAVLLDRRTDPLDKLKAQARVRDRKPEDDGKTALRQGGGPDRLDRFANYLEPKSAEEMSTARLRMVQAGYRSKSAVRTLHAIQFVLSISLLIVGILYTIVLSTMGSVSLQGMILITLGPAALGYFLPDYWVRRRLQSRRKELINGFPDALDMLLICIEAGQSLELAIIRVSKEMRMGYPALAEEFDIISNELKAGKERVQVLRDMSDRAGVPDITSFTAVLVQSANFGTSLADALRIYAAEMRDKRLLRAEERANVLPTKLSLGTMLFTVPPFLIILVGPSIYQIYLTFTSGKF